MHVVDTSSIIDLSPYAFDVFSSLWRSIEGLIREGRFVAPRQVLEELSRRDDDLLKWAKSNKRMFEPPSLEVSLKAKEILSRFPGLIDANSAMAEADPFVVASALAPDPRPPLFPRRRLVVSEENLKPGKINIPAVCSHYKIDCITIIEFFRREGWTF